MVIDCVVLTFCTYHFIQLQSEGETELLELIVSCNNVERKFESRITW